MTWREGFLRCLFDVFTRKLNICASLWAAQTSQVARVFDQEGVPQPADLHLDVEKRMSENHLTHRNKTAMLAQAKSTRRRSENTMTKLQSDPVLQMDFRSQSQDDSLAEKKEQKRWSLPCARVNSMSLFVSFRSFIFHVVGVWNNRIQVNGGQDTTALITRSN